MLSHLHLCYLAGTAAAEPGAKRCDAGHYPLCKSRQTNLFTLGELPDKARKSARCCCTASCINGVVLSVAFLSELQGD